MLELKVYDRGTEVVLRFEHSLLSLSKWEARTKVAFLGRAEKSPTELIDYFQDMLVSPDVDPNLVFRLSPPQLDELAKYISDKQTASSVPALEQGGPKETITSELIYYWLSEHKIPFHPTETWHLNRIMMLVQIANYKRTPEKKRLGKNPIANWREMSAKNRERFGSSG